MLFHSNRHKEEVSEEEDEEIFHDLNEDKEHR